MRRSLILVAGLTTLGAQERPLFPWDPVALVGGTQVVGAEAHQATHEGYTYRFQHAASLATFRAQPGRYAIQLGGACARMGILSGKGSPNRFTVHEGRIYVFASDGCRATFLKDPSRVLETLDPWTEPSASERAEAQRRLALAVKAHGGAAALRAVRTLAWERTFEEVSGGKTYARRMARTLTSGGGVNFEDAWDASAYRYVDGPEGGRYEGGKATETLSDLQRAWVRRTHRWHEPMALLAAALEGQARIAPGAGASLQVHVEGVTTRLDLDSESHRVVRTEHRGWTGGFLGTVQRTYSGFQRVGPLLVATVVESGGRAAAWTSIAVDDQRWENGNSK